MGLNSDVLGIRPGCARYDLTVLEENPELNSQEQKHKAEQKWNAISWQQQQKKIQLRRKCLPPGCFQTLLASQLPELIKNTGSWNPPPEVTFQRFRSRSEN